MSRARRTTCICDATALRIYSTMACEAIAVLARIAPGEKDRILVNADRHHQRIRRERSRPCPECGRS